MPKRRNEGASQLVLASEQPQQSDPLKRRESSSSPSPPIKRARNVPLSFSIESIMQPAVQELAVLNNQQQQQQHNLNLNHLNYHQHLHLNNHLLNLNALNHNSHQQAPHVLEATNQLSRSNSPASSIASSRRSVASDLSNASPHANASGDRSVPGVGGAHSPGASSTISRASTPISPGCCEPAGARNDHSGLPNSSSVQFNSQQQRAQSNAANQQRGAQKDSNSLSKSSSKVANASSSGWARERGQSSNQLLRQPVCTDARLAPFKCHLDNLDLWHRFHPLDTEMIITKQGRRMFPPVRVTFSLDELAATTLTSGQQNGVGGPQLALNGRDKYQVLMDILPYDGKRYRYAYHKSSWQQAGKADPPSPTKLFLHPDGPFTLDQLKRQSVISFEKIKLTNNDANKHGYIVLNSMHKYQPRIHLVLWRGKESQNLMNAPISMLDHEPHKTFIFSETIFTAVTAYQNHSITKLKIDSNPFAKGFRDSTRLTDLELESMQDLISDGQCPFSPPRAPPPGFPHFLFANATGGPPGGLGPPPHFGLPPPPPPPPHSQAPPGGLQQYAPLVSAQNQMTTHNHSAPSGTSAGGGEEATASLLRERTIMALDSFLLQQQQQQQQACGEGANQLAHQLVASHHQRLGGHSPGGAPNANGGGPNPQQANLSQPPTSQPGNGGGGGQLEQFIMQQQQQFAAAMAAAAAAAAAAHQHPSSQAALQQLFAGSQQLPNLSAPSPQSLAAANQQHSGPNTPLQMPQPVTCEPAAATPNLQTSPIGAAKTAARNQMQQQQQQASQMSSPLGSYAANAVSLNHAIQAHHLQALMMQHHHHQQAQQMAALSMQQQQFGLPPPPPPGNGDLAASSQARHPQQQPAAAAAQQATGKRHSPSCA